MSNLLREKPGTASRRKEDPWEILVVAAMFYLPGVLLLSARGKAIAFSNLLHGGAGQPQIVSPLALHATGVFMLVASILLFWGYLRVRREIRSGSWQRDRRRHR
jgi:hypothetical protein